MTAADAEQLEQRRHELEEERFGLVNQLSAQDRKLRDWRAQRATVDRQRAALLSARSIEYLQRELATVQQKLQQALPGESADDAEAFSDANTPRASDILAKLTDGRLVRLELVDHGRNAHVWTRDGVTVPIESLSPGERDQVYLSFSLALAAAAERQAARLPLLLDEPFLRLDPTGTAALAAVLDDLGRHGQQILVFTGQREAAERLASLGAPVREISNLRKRVNESLMVTDGAAPALPAAIRPVATKKTKTIRRKVANGKPPKVRGVDATNGDASSAEQSDAA